MPTHRSKSHAQALSAEKAQLTRRAMLFGGAYLAAAAVLFPKIARAEKMNLTNGLAIEGHDPVAYFTENRPVRGDADFTSQYNGATYRFASAANRDTFIANPAKYAPKYGGYCAYAVSQGYTAPIDPAAFSVVNGALYLNYSKRVRKIWNRDIPGNIKAADENWPKLSA